MSSKRILVFLGVIAVLALQGAFSAQVSAQTNPTITVADVSIPLGLTASVPITIDTVPVEGLAGFDLVVAFAGTSTAVILGATLPDYGLIQILPVSGGLRLRAADLNQLVQGGETAFVLATLEVQGVESGAATLTLTVDRLDGDEGGGITVQTQDGSISVAFPTLPGASSPALDLDGDGLAEDVNGNGRLDFADVVLFFHALASPEVLGHVAVFDYDQDGGITFADVVRLFELRIAIP